MAESESAKVLSSQSNVAVVQLPSRRYPGSVIQGDSLFSLLSDTLDVLDALKGQPDSEAFHTALSVAVRLEERLAHYISICEANGIESALRSERSTKDYSALIDQGSE